MLFTAAAEEISIHALREEGDFARPLHPGVPQRFLSTPSARRATTPHRSGIPLHGDFYPRPPRGGRREEEAGVYRISMISIHALREEGDSPAGGGVCAQDNFYPRPPRGGRRNMGCSWACPADFYPRPPRGGRHAGRRGRSRRGRISIHALREEGDTRHRVFCQAFFYFYPRPPRGGRRPALRWYVRSTHFYPRPPRGGRRREVLHHAPKYVFLSTPSARRATHALGSERLDVGISIHALREEGDQIADGLPRILGISIHALREEGDAAWPTRWASAQYFYPRPPRGGRRSERRK